MDTKSIIGSLILMIVLFVIPYFWRKNREEDILKHSKYAIGRVYKKVGSNWYYRYSYDDKTYEDGRKLKLWYDVRMGDYFLIQFSSKNPDHSKILYEYLLREDKIDFNNYVGDTIPYSILYFRKGKERDLW